jgi:hypothetical protein
MDVAHGEMVEQQLDAMTLRRSRPKDPDEEHERWRESVRRYEEKRRQMARLEWHAFHCGQAERHRRTLEELVSYHETQAAKLCEGEGAIADA